MRTIIPVRQATQQQIDALREFVSADLLSKAMEARPAVKHTDWIVRQVLPWNDLRIVSAGQAAPATDFWGCGAQVASTLIIYVNRVLPDNMFVGIYGIQIRDTNPNIIKVLFQTGAAASTTHNLSVEPLYGEQVPEGLIPEYVYWAGGSTAFCQLLPSAVAAGKAAGADGVSDHVILLGLVAQPAGEIVSY